MSVLVYGEKGIKQRANGYFQDCNDGSTENMRTAALVMGLKWGQNGVKDTRCCGGNEKRQNQQLLILPELVRVKGLEPLRRTTPDPKSGASAIPPHSLDITDNSLPYFSLLFKLVVIFTNFAKSIGKGQQV